MLRDRGLLDEDEHAELAAKAAKEQAKREWTERISIWGDLRLRFESFDYKQDIYTTRGRRRAR